MPFIHKRALAEQDLINIWHNHAHHVIVYQALEDGIDVIRVLHENMDVSAWMEG